MEKVTITGRRLRAPDNEIPENAPDSMKYSMSEKSILKTDVGVFELDEFGDVINEYSGSSIYNSNLDEFVDMGEFDVSLVLSDFQLYYTTSLPKVLSEGDTLLVDMSVVNSEFGIQSDTQEIILKIDEVLNVNVSGSQEKCLSFLGETYNYSDEDGNFSLTGNSNDYPDRSRCYVVRRSDDNTMKQRTILNEETVDKLVKNGGIELLNEVN